MSGVYGVIVWIKEKVERIRERDHTGFICDATKFEFCLSAMGNNCRVVNGGGVRSDMFWWKDSGL